MPILKIYTWGFHSSGIWCCIMGNVFLTYQGLCCPTISGNWLLSVASLHHCETLKSCRGLLS